MYFKYTCQDEVGLPFSCVDFARRDRTVPPSYRLPLYSHLRFLSMEKAADILKLMKFVPPLYHTFYSSRCIHEVDERKTDETVRLTRVVSSFLASS